VNKRGNLRSEKLNESETESLSSKLVVKHLIQCYDEKWRDAEEKTQEAWPFEKS